MTECPVCHDTGIVRVDENDVYGGRETVEVRCAEPIHLKIATGPGWWQWFTRKIGARR